MPGQEPWVTIDVRNPTASQYDDQPDDKLLPDNVAEQLLEPYARFLRGCRLNAVLEFVERNRYAPRELVLERLKRERDEAKALQRSGKFYQAFELYDHVDQEVSNLLMYAMRDVVNVEKSLNRGGKEFLDAGSELYSSSASGIATGLLQYIKHHLRLDGVVVATGGPPRPRLGYSARELAISKIEQAFEQPPNDVDYKWELDDEKSARLRLLEAYLHRVGSEWEGEEIRYAWMNIQQALALKPDSLAI